MNKGVLSKSDVKGDSIALDKSLHDLFKPFIGRLVTIKDQDDCEFEFEVKSSKTGKISLTKTESFIDLLDLKEGDEIHFVPGDKNGSFVVVIKKNDPCPNAAPMDDQEKDTLKGVISEIYKTVVEEYKYIFNEKHYLPTKEASTLIINGFTERNLTFNFCQCYLKQQPDAIEHPNAIVWQEIPIISVDNEHIDSIIIDYKNNWVIYLEAKRLYDFKHFKSLLNDLDRIKKFHSDFPLPKELPTNKAVVLLADHYYHGNGKKSKEKKCYDAFFTGKDVEGWLEICKDINLAKKLASRVKLAKIDAVCDKTLTIPIKGEYNIKIAEEIFYTIYCGVFFIE